MGNGSGDFASHWKGVVRRGRKSGNIEDRRITSAKQLPHGPVDEDDDEPDEIDRLPPHTRAVTTTTPTGKTASDALRSGYDRGTTLAALYPKPTATVSVTYQTESNMKRPRRSGEAEEEP